MRGSKKGSIYVRQIRVEGVNNVVIGEAFSRESVPRSSDFCEEVIRMELTSC